MISKESGGPELLVESLLPSVIEAVEVLGHPKKKREVPHPRRRFLHYDEALTVSRDLGVFRHLAGLSLLIRSRQTKCRCDRLCLGWRLTRRVRQRNGEGRPPDSSSWNFSGSTLAWGLVGAMGAPVWAAGRRESPYTVRKMRGNQTRLS